MTILVILASARADLADLNRRIAWDSGDAQAGRRFVASIIARCEHMAGLPGTLGQARPDLRADMRSTPHRGYVIFFRYADDRLEIVNVLAARRDIEGFFGGGEDG